MVGNSQCFGHVQCDSIIMGAAHIQSVPAITANCPDAQLIHEAAIGKIAGDQLLKLETLGLTPEEAEEVCEGIRAIIRSRHGARVARSVSILYGGSMNAKNARELLSMPDIDGGLIGGASLKPVDFSKIIEAVSEVSGEE